jgi:hypothetical protein
MLKFPALRVCLMVASVPLLSTCADNDASAYVVGVLAPKAPACEFKADPGATRLLSGLLDVAFRQSYSAVVLVANQMTPRGDKEQLRSETAGIEIQGAEVRLTDGQDSVLDEFSVPAGGFIQANDSDEAGYGVASVTLIPASRGAAFADDLIGSGGEIRKVVANVRVFGTTLGGIEVTSGASKFPIDVCYGCSIVYPSEAMENGECLITADAPNETACRTGQDSNIDCRNCSAVNQACLSPAFL